MSIVNLFNIIFSHLFNTPTILHNIQVKKTNKMYVTNTEFTKGVNINHIGVNVSNKMFKPDSINKLSKYIAVK